MRGPKDLSKRTMQAIVIGVALFVALTLTKQLLPTPEALRSAEEFLRTHPTVAKWVGPEVKVDAELVTRSYLGWTPGTTFTTYELRVTGHDGTLRTRVELKNPPDSDWIVYSATLWTPKGPVTLD